MKNCRTCGEEKPLTDFYKNPKMKDGYVNHCIPCQKQQRAWKYKNGGKETQASYRAKNKDKRQQYWLASDAKPERKAKRLELDRKHPERGRAKASRQKAEKLQRTPPWADMEEIRSVYAEAARLESETSMKWHVDHIIPLRGELVSGLHVASNLQLLTAEENLKKTNKFQPGTVV